MPKRARRSFPGTPSVRPPCTSVELNRVHESSWTLSGSDKSRLKLSYVHGTCDGGCAARARRACCAHGADCAGSGCCRYALHRWSVCDQLYMHGLVVHVDERSTQVDWRSHPDRKRRSHPARVAVARLG